MAYDQRRCAMSEFKSFARDFLAAALPERREPVAIALRVSPFPPQLVAVAEQPVERDQRVAGLDPAGIDHRFQFGDGADDDTNILAFLGHPVDAGGLRRIDAAAKQHDGFVRIAGRGQVKLDRHKLADHLDPGLLERFAPGDLLLALAFLVDEAGDNLDDPGGKPGDQRRQAELLDEDDFVAARVVEHDRHRAAAPHHVVDALAAPRAGIEPVAVAHHIEPQMAAEGDLVRDDPESLTRNGSFALNLLRDGGRGAVDWRGGARRWRSGWLLRSPWPGAGCGRARRRYVRRPIAGAAVGSL